MIFLSFHHCSSSLPTFFPSVFITHLPCTELGIVLCALKKEEEFIKENDGERAGGCVIPGGRDILRDRDVMLRLEGREGSIQAMASGDPLERESWKEKPEG